MQEVSRASAVNSSPSDAQSADDSLKDVDVEVGDTTKSITEKLAAALVSIRSKEDLVKQHAKVAEEALLGKLPDTNTSSKHIDNSTQVCECTGTNHLECKRTQPVQSSLFDIANNKLGLCSDENCFISFHALPSCLNIVTMLVGVEF